MNIKFNNMDQNTNSVNVGKGTPVAFVEVNVEWSGMGCVLFTFDNEEQARGFYLANVMHSVLGHRSPDPDGYDDDIEKEMKRDIEDAVASRELYYNDNRVKFWTVDDTEKATAAQV